RISAHPTGCSPSGTKACEVMERLSIEGGARMVNAARDRVLSHREAMLSAVDAPPDEWYGRAEIEPDHLVAFMSDRLDNIEALARLSHWRGMADAAGGEYSSGGGLVLPF